MPPNAIDTASNRGDGHSAEPQTARKVAPYPLRFFSVAGTQLEIHKYRSAHYTRRVSLPTFFVILAISLTLMVHLHRLSSRGNTLS